MSHVLNVMRVACLTLLFAVQSALALPDGAVNVNAASASELASALTGVGQSRAEAIVTYREQHGDFVDLDELMAVKGIGRSVIEKNQGKIFFAEE